LALVASASVCSSRLSSSRPCSAGRGPCLPGEADLRYCSLVHVCDKGLRGDLHDGQNLEEVVLGEILVGVVRVELVVDCQP
jgi:hypothetical protein